jgi:hypothetical protein
MTDGKKNEQLWFLFFSRNNGLVVQQFLTAEAASEASAALGMDGYVTSIVPVSVEERFLWNGAVSAEYSVKALRDDLIAAHALDAAGVKLDTESTNEKGVRSLRRMTALMRESTEQ